MWEITFLTMVHRAFHNLASSSLLSPMVVTSFQSSLMVQKTTSWSTLMCVYCEASHVCSYPVCPCLCCSFCQQQFPQFLVSFLQYHSGVCSNTLTRNGSTDHSANCNPCHVFSFLTNFIWGLVHVAKMCLFVYISTICIYCCLYNNTWQHAVLSVTYET